MDHTVWFDRARRLAVLSLILVPVGCSQPAFGASQPASPNACAELGAQLCKGGADAMVQCKSTLDLLTPAACTSALSTVQISLQKLADKRKVCDKLVTRLCSDLGAETETCAMVRESKAELSHDRCETMLNEYGDVLAELKQQEERSKPLSVADQAKLTQGSPPAFGPTGAKVTLVEFSDFQCPFCSRAAEVVHAVRDKYADRVHFVFRQYPLSFHDHAHVSAEAALAAHAQGKFWALHDKLFDNQDRLDRASLESYAQEIGLDMEAFKLALDDGRYAAAVDAELELGETVAVDGTPTLFINGKRVDNPTSVEAVSKAIEAALAKAKS